MRRTNLANGFRDRRPGIARDSSGEWLAQASLSSKSGRLEEAVVLLEELLISDPTHVLGLELLCDVFGRLNRLHEAKRFTDAAIAALPANPRLQLLAGDVDVRLGNVRAGIARFQSALAKTPTNAAAWLGLTRAMAAQGDFDGAVVASQQALAACPDAQWLWGRHLQMLDTLGKAAELRRHLDSREAPVPGATAEFLSWARWMTSLDAHDRVRAALDTAPSDARSALRATGDGCSLLVELALSSGEPLQAIDILQDQLSANPQDRRLLRHLFDLALWTGDTALAESMASKLHAADPRTHGGLPMFLLHEMRIFAQPMRRVREVACGPAGERLAGLSRIVMAEPTCLPAACAWVNELAAELRRTTAAPREATCIPRRLIHFDEPTADWRAHHSSYHWVDLRNGAHASSALQFVPAPIAAKLMRLPSAARIDIVKLAVLKAIGGWWVTPTMHCAAPIDGIAAGGDLVISLNETGYVTTAHMGAVAEHPAMAAAFDFAVTVLDEIIARDNASPITTGMPALTLGLAASLAPVVLRGDAVDGVRLTTPMQRWRRLGLWWPK
jgi:tetratricopeptide (TPR) repeat protein